MITGQQRGLLLSLSLACMVAQRISASNLAVAQLHAASTAAVATGTAVTAHSQPAAITVCQRPDAACSCTVN